jgi:hypothetical protein
MCRSSTGPLPRPPAMSACISGVCRNSPTTSREIDAMRHPMPYDVSKFFSSRTDRS